MEHAEHACDLTDFEDWLSLEALAVAYAGRGDFARAVEAAQRAADTAPGEHGERCWELVQRFQASEPWLADWPRRVRLGLPELAPR